MNTSTVSFIAWGATMLVILVGMLLAVRRSKVVQDEAEDIASKALPEIGGIAVKKHHERFGCAPTDAPGANDSWYPEAKKKFAKRSVI